jgi:hypothetical protein
MASSSIWMEPSSTRRQPSSSTGTRTPSTPFHNHLLSLNIFRSVGGEIGVDPEVILETSHGRRSIDILKILAPEKANWECAYTKP